MSAKPHVLRLYETLICAAAQLLNMSRHHRILISVLIAAIMLIVIVYLYYERQMNALEEKIRLQAP